MEGAAARIHLCGHLAVEWGGERLEGALPGRQGRLLFAYLALNRERPVRRDELAEALWGSGEGPPGGGDAQLAPPLSRLRKALGAGRLEGRSELRLVLPENTWIDWEAAQHGLEQARASLESANARGAWDSAQASLAITDRGLLPGLEAEWIDERRRELADLRVELLEAAAQAGAHLGGAELQSAQDAARSAVEAAPFRESARAALMEVLFARGNVAEALRAYEEVRILLRDELGASPGPKLVALHERLLRAQDEPPPEPAPQPARPAPPRLVPQPAPAPAGPQLVEREHEVATLRSLLDETATGQGRLALIEGPAGIGKSRLLAEVRHQAIARETLALSARASELEREFPFGVVRQLFEAVVATPEENERAFAGAAAPARSVFEAGPGGTGELGSGAAFAALHGLYWLTLNLAAERPLLLAIDDIHWADLQSLRFVAYLVRRLEGVPLLVSTTLRTGEAVTDPALIEEIAHDAYTESVRPGPLSEAAVYEIVRDRLGPDADERFCAACHEATGGNPLLLRQLLTALEADGVQPERGNARVVHEIGPRAISRGVLMRLSRLPGEAVGVARAVAVLGESADLPAVAALAQLDEQAVARATGSLARAEILRAARPLGFVHALVRDAVYHDLPPGERELLHAQAAQVLLDAGASADQVASHLLVVPARGEAWVGNLLRDAGRSAMHKGSPESATSYLRRALEEPPPVADRAQLVYELGVAEELTSAVTSLATLRQAYEQLSDPVTKTDAARRVARTLIFTEKPERAPEFAREVIAELPAERDDERKALEAHELIAPWFGAVDDTEGALARLEGYRTEPVGDGPGAKMLAALVAWYVVNRGGSTEEALGIAYQALDGGVLAEADAGLFLVPAVTVLVMADREEGMLAWNEALAESHRTGSLLDLAAITLWRGFALLTRGDLEEAEDSLNAAVDHLKVWGNMIIGPTYAAAFLGRTLIERGKLAEARDVLQNVQVPPIAADGSRLWQRACVELLIAEGDGEAALRAADRLAGLFPWIESSVWAPWRSLKAQALELVGRHDEAIELAGQEVALARRWGANGVVGRALRICGTIKGADGLTELEEAAELLATSTFRSEHARALVALGRALREAGEEADARELLEHAVELAEVCGADALAEEARAELRESGVQLGPVAPTGIAALTERERRVAALAAEGESNRDIAQALFVTPKTVEVHLTNAYKKLGVRSRQELPAALAEAA